ncbi:hypothetical protein GWK10_05130 [Spongiivirga citrea]|uniref:Nuclear transport factor 2 family protein n=1 Tax=Spongiivirga citrea TaxID=1481457 RepID=A0A6M0CFK2_9FLAO|nr:hypothetical protein [Spongiivirga citrea]
MKKLLLISCVLLTQCLLAQTEEDRIRETLTKYIDGSTGGQPKLLKEAFHPDLNLYYVKNDQVSIWSGEA